MMDDRAYSSLVDKVFSRITTALDRLDPDEIDVDSGGGYLTLTFRDQTRCVVSTQRPVQETWMAADNTAWHFSAPAESQGGWVARKTGEELFASLSKLVSAKMGQPVSI